MPALDLKDDKEVFEAIAQKISSITGVQLGEKQSSLVISRLSKHLRNLGGMTARQYWEYLAEHEAEEVPILISLLTTHHTFFFREQVHFEFLEKELPRLVKQIKEAGRNTVRVWCAACSHGQEGYTIAMFLDYHLKQLVSGMDYRITFSDVDQESVKVSSHGIYRNDELNRVPVTYRSNHWSRGTGNVDGYSKIKTKISQYCDYKVINLLELHKLSAQEPYDIIFVRNVFIYFTGAEIERITNNLLKHLVPEGLLFIGVSESLMGLKVPVDHIGKSIYQPLRDKPIQDPEDKVLDAKEDPVQNSLRRRESKLASELRAKKPRTLSDRNLSPRGHAERAQPEKLSMPTAPALPSTKNQEGDLAVPAFTERSVLILQRSLQIGFHTRQVINGLPGFKSVGIELISSLDEALQKIQQKHADLLVLESGALRFLSPALGKMNLPTLIVNSLESPVQAADVQQWPHVRIFEQDLKSDRPGQREAILRTLDQLARLDTPRPKIASSAQVLTLDSTALIAFGASTGGTEALGKVIADLPANMPPIVIVQHIPEGFSRAFANRLDQISQLTVKEAVDGDKLQVGHVLVAPGDKHMVITGRPGQYKVHVYSGEKVSGHRPSVDVLFHSLAEHVKGRMIGVIMTGMGSDGAEGLLQMKNRGALTFGQDATTSVVYGMPKVAHQIGAVGKVLPLNKIAQELVKALSVTEKN